MDQKAKPVIYIVDDDKSVRRAMERLIRSAGMNTASFDGAEAFLNFNYKNTNACLVTDISMPGMGGLGLQAEMVRRGSILPVIFITAFDTPETHDLAKKAGADGYLRKPVDDQALLDLIRWVITKQDS